MYYKLFIPVTHPLPFINYLLSTSLYSSLTKTPMRQVVAKEINRMDESYKNGFAKNKNVSVFSASLSQHICIFIGRVGDDSFVKSVMLFLF